MNLVEALECNLQKLTRDQLDAARLPIGVWKKEIRNSVPWTRDVEGWPVFSKSITSELRKLNLRIDAINLRDAELQAGRKGKHAEPVPAEATV